MAAKSLADQLLDAQVAFVLAEFSEDRLAELIARDVDDVLEIAASLVVADVVARDAAKALVRKVVDRAGSSPIAEDMVVALAESLYGLAASEQFTLGEVVDREPIEALVTKVLSMHRTHDRALERMGESPLIASLMSTFVTKIVADFLQQNRQRAEKLPGMGSLLSLGSSVASKAKGVTDRHLDQFLGDAMGKGAQYTMRRTNKVIGELIRDPQMHGAVMELWDLHAAEPISGLRDYLSQSELSEIVVLVHALLVSTRGNEYVGLALDECVDVFFDRYGAWDVAALATELGIDRDGLVADLCTLVPPVIEAAKANGVLDAQIRKRLAPFFHSAGVAALLTKPKPR
ncbi:MAG: hypothetical protein ABI232_01265 [Jatrophihabitantaceae bacterium]